MREAGRSIAQIADVLGVGVGVGVGVGKSSVARAVGKNEPAPTTP
ncbi:hypothetical protein [Rathayibacter rathayi]|nr:hypothetical protein [Rathayibacter rathayi]